MARKIEQIDKQMPDQVEINAEALKLLTDQIAENQRSLTVFLEIIEELHAAGILDLMKGLLKTRDKVGALAVEQLNQPGAHRMIKNGMSLLQTASQIEPEQLTRIMNGMTKGLQATAQHSSNEPVSMWQMVKMMRDPHVNASLQTMLGFMQGMGQELNKNNVH
ncbi:DUF1641 domain-containing protein [Alkalihalobacillus oceani]|uniref:DUF1641 domain-containing protein n=1 Tax=Halalkalibacter oceani TaxID=1653776 RepID=UPI002040F6FB|nr:DUF1641 domain-containing protein [Halalkalibacter oceani]MCM3762979.1 DUF1641 domain-containing protein [Halalkalibacter oceani]